MAMQYSTAVRNAQLDALEALFLTGKLRIYSGAAPANPSDAATGTLLADITLPADPMAAASGGSKAKSGTWATSSASASGTAGYFRVLDSAGTVTHIQGTVGTSSADLIVDSVTFTAGQAFTVTSFTLTTQEA